MNRLSSQPVAAGINAESYRAVLALGRHMGYAFVGFGEAKQFERFVILRHDVDVDLGYAGQMAAIETDMGARSTYFIMLHNPLYNPWSGSGRRLLGQLVAGGHAIGLHFEPRFHQPVPLSGIEQIVERVEEEAALLATLVGAPVDLVSFHQPVPQLLNVRLPSSRCRSTYEPEFTESIRYIADSGGRWRQESIQQLLSAGTTHRIQFLSHPVLWLAGNQSTLQERLAAAVAARQARVPEELADAVNDPERGMVLFEHE